MGGVIYRYWWDTDAFLICIKIRQFQLRSAYLALSTYHFYTSNRNHLLHNSVLYTFAFLCIVKKNKSTTSFFLTEFAKEQNNKD